MSRWTEPGLSPEERAGAVVDEVAPFGADFVEDVLTAAIRTAVEEATAKERERCVGVARARRDEMRAETESFRQQGWYRTAHEYDLRADTAEEIARRISGEGETR